MTIEEIETEANRIRAGPLMVLCRTREGKERVLTIGECIESRSQFVHVVVDELDKFLGRELGGDSEPVYRRKPSE